MKFGPLSDEQVGVIVQMMSAVVSAAGRVAPLPIEIDCVDAAQRHLLRRDPPLPCLTASLQPNMRESLAPHALRKCVVRLLATLATADQQLSVDKVAVVDEAAARLDVSEFGLTLLHRAARGRFRRSGFGLMRRFVNYYWSYSRNADLRDWAAMLWTVAPWIPGLDGYLKLPEVLDRYRGLASLPHDTLGYAVHDYYAQRGFPTPGAPKSIPEGWARHEVYHVLANYNTNLQGELLLAGFISGNTDELSLDIVLPALIQLHVGKAFIPGPVAEGILIPDEFYRAVARGAAMNVDLLAGWRLWDVAGTRLHELQKRYEIPPFSRQEYSKLVEEDALLERAS
jgi:hypothetical protein